MLGLFPGFPLSLILCSSPSGLGAGSYIGPAVGGVLEHALTCCAAWVEQRERDIHRDTEGERGREKLVVNTLPVWSDPHNGGALQPWWTYSCWCQHPECTHWRRAWMEELHCCLAAWWVSKLCVNKNLSHIILQLSTCASVLVNCYCRERTSTLKLQKD